MGDDSKFKALFIDSNSGLAIYSFSSNTHEQIKINEAGSLKIIGFDQELATGIISAINSISTLYKSNINNIIVLSDNKNLDILRITLNPFDNYILYVIIIIDKFIKQDVVKQIEESIKTEIIKDTFNKNYIKEFKGSIDNITSHVLFTEVKLNTFKNKIRDLIKKGKEEKKDKIDSLVNKSVKKVKDEMNNKIKECLNYLFDLKTENQQSKLLNKNIDKLIEKTIEWVINNFEISTTNTNNAIVDLNKIKEFEFINENNFPSSLESNLSPNYIIGVLFSVIRMFILMYYYKQLCEENMKTYEEYKKKYIDNSKTDNNGALAEFQMNIIKLTTKEEDSVIPGTMNAISSFIKEFGFVNEDNPKIGLIHDNNKILIITPKFQ